MSDLKSIVIDEIALEGLDGITINALWIRLEHRTDFKFNLKQQSSKEFIWKNVILKISSIDLQYYLLPECRPILQYHNRYDFISPETGYCINDEDQIPDDIYADVSPICENGERGSCKFYKSRKQISFDDLKDLSLNQIQETYGEKLSIVANQRIRENSLRINYNDPQIELSAIQYCILERVGRARKLGEISFGKESGNFKDPPKTLFYFRKLLLKKNLITKQTHTVYNLKTQTITRGLLLMLPRFHIDRKSPLELAAQKIFEILKTLPDHKCEYFLLKSKMNIRPKPFKHVFTEFDKNFRVYDQNVQKSGKKIKARFVQLIKNLDEENDDSELSDSDDIENDDDNQATNSNGICNGNNKVKLFSPRNIKINRSLLSQSYDIVKSYSSLNGISLREFQSELVLPRLDARMLIRMLERLDEVTTITTNIGRQKIIRYFLKNKVNQAVTSFNNENDQLDLGKKSTLITLKRANLILNAVKEHKIIDQLVFFKKIILEAEKNLPYTIDQKSIKTIISTLAQEGHLNWIKRTLESNNQIREYNLVCIPSIKEDDEIVKERIEQARFRSFAIINQESVDDIENNVLSNKKDEFDDWSQKIQNCDTELIYQPSAGRKYGLEPKMKKLVTFYKFLFFVLSDECKRDNDFNDWRKYITPLPKSYEKDSCLLGDLIPRMPLSIFTKVVFITFVIPGLKELLNDPVRCNYTLQMLPTDIVKNLFRRRKYLFSMVELLTSLTYLNLVELINNQTQVRESVAIKLLKTAQFIEDDYVKNYRLENLNDVESFINDIALHSSRIDCKKCSFDSRLYIHNPRNWSYLPKIHRVQMKGIRRFERLRNVIDKDGENITQNSIPPTKSKAPTTKKRKSSSKKQSKSKRMKVQKTNQSTNDSTAKKVRSKAYDKEDINALSLLRKQRSEWSREEDSFLLMCRVASVLLHPTSVNFICVSKRIIRNELYKYLPNIAFDKTSTACQRRVMYMLKNPRTRAHVLDWVAECKQDPEFSTIKKPNVPMTHEDEWNNSYIDLLNKLLKKFQNEHFIRPLNTIENFKSLDEIYKRYDLIESEIHCVPQKPVLYFQPNNIVDIYVNTVLNVIASSLLINLFDNNEEYNTKSALALFKIYQRYPDTMIRSVVTKMKQNGMMAKLRENDKFRLRNKSNHKITLHKISQHYCFVLKSRYSMDTLSMPIELTDDFIIDNFGSTQIALLTSLMCINRVRLNITIPENFITYRDSHQTKANTIQKDSNNNLINEDSMSTVDQSLSRTNEPSNKSSIILNEQLIDQSTWANLNKRASRFVLCSVRQKMDLATKFSQTDQDFLILNKCNVNCKITSAENLIDLNEFLQLIEKKNVYVDPNGDYLNEIELNSLERQIVKEVAKTKELGLNHVQFSNEFLEKRKIDELTLKQTISKLCDQQVLFEVGVVELRLVTHKFVFPWLANVEVPLSEYDQLTNKTTRNQNNSIDQNQSSSNKDENNILNQPIQQEIRSNQNNDKNSSTSTKIIQTNETVKSKMVFYQPKFWKNPFGQPDKRVIIIFLSGILGYIMSNPGITNEDLISYFKFCLPPVQTNEFVDLLVAAKCINRFEQIIESNYTLFNDCEQKKMIYYEPTKKAFITICAIKHILTQ